MSTEKSIQKDILKLFAYSNLANFMVTVASRGEVDEEEGKALLRIQNDLIKQYDSTLAAHLDPESMDAFREFVRKYRARMD